ncbi:hypothetical protein C1645_834219 [Glomus cerebriforme]|uniref:Uncharacterized protein n=1 Tax=Glomus cerebriforme TaxID=658196 RepID=A0A397S9Y3_9GLOM|nr:hypothetical protein C1645_834219 [Glomus cerebriforme]
MPYELIYGDKPHSGCSLINELFTRSIYNEEDIPKTIQIADFENSAEDLDNNIEEVTVINHTILREAAQRDLEHYTEKMVNQMNKGKKRLNYYEIGDLVRISVPKINYFGIDRPTLPCKVLEKINDQYRLGFQFGIINVFYSHGEINTFGIKHFPELETISTNIITVKEATRLQNVGLTTRTICNCKGNCNSKKCNYRKMGNNCRSRYHGGRHCQNKHEDN